MEIKEIEGFSGYFISEYGDVYSTKRGDWRKRKTWIAPNGYENIILTENSKQHARSIHRLVAETFLGGVQDNMQVNHKDCDKSNNHYSNLEWCTAKYNTHHALNNGHYSVRGEGSGRSNCTEHQVHRICGLLQDGILQKKDIADICDVSLDTVLHIGRGTAWVHISYQYRIPSGKTLSDKLTEDEVKCICLMLNAGLQSRAIQEQTNCSKYTISKIKTGKSYKEISKKYLHAASKTIESTSSDGSE